MITTFFSSLSFGTGTVFGSGIRDPGSGMGKNQDPLPLSKAERSRAPFLCISWRKCRIVIFIFCLVFFAIPANISFKCKAARVLHHLQHAAVRLPLCHLRAPRSSGEAQPTVLGIRHILVRIPIGGSVRVPLTNGSGSNFFLQWLMDAKKNIFSYFFLITYQQAHYLLS